MSDRKTWHTDYDGGVQTVTDVGQGRVHISKSFTPISRRREQILKGVPEHAKGLLHHLADNGTGVSKLEALSDIAKKCKEPDDFVEQAARMVPSGTIDKINKYLSDKRLEAKSAEVLSKEPKGKDK